MELIDMLSFRRLLPSGTELFPLFPYLRAGLLKRGGGGQRRYTPRQLGTGIRPEAYRFPDLKST